MRTITRSSVTGRFVAAAQALVNPQTTVIEQVEVFPYAEGDTIVIGPQCFADTDGTVINWRGVNYYREGRNGAS